MTQPGLLSGEHIRQLLGEVAEQLAPGRQATVLIVGGSLLAWHGLRQATEDVDTIMRLDAELKDAVRVVAARHGLAADWLNDHSAPWRPATLRVEDCDVLIEHPALLVLGAPLASIFLMKLNRSQPEDVSDMITLWPHVADVFPTARTATEAYYEAFPNEEHDEYLATQVVDVARRSGDVLPLE